jgi:hypothetical protein
MPEKKNLPVKLFNKREQDAFLNEPGGSNDLPNWVLPLAVLEAKCEEFRDSLAETEQLISSRPPGREFIPAVITVTINREAIAKSHRDAIGKVFNRKRENNFIGMADDLEFLIKVEDQSHLSSILRALERPAANPVGLSAIDELGAFKPIIELPGDDSQLKIKLVHYQEPVLNASIEAAFESTLKQLEVRYRKTVYAEGITVFKASHLNGTALDEIIAFEALYSITPMPMFSVGTDEFSSEAPPNIRYPEPGKNYAVVGILDSGIAPIPHLAPWLDSRSFSAYPPQYVDPAHGTFVAGIVEYGDALEGTDWVGNDGCILFNATVFPNEPIDEDELIDNISRAVRMHPDIKIWNLSGGGTAECNLYDFSDFAQALDKLQEELDILICKSAGNCKNFLSGLPVQRITKSADSLRSLVVGSIAHAKGLHDIALAENPSPFSRIGYGPNRTVKPDLTHYGGNSGVLPDGRLTSTGVKSFSPLGGIVRSVGTSFSTPRVSALVGGLTGRLAEEFDPLVAKALVIHSAKYPTSVTLSQTDRIQQMGYGLPSSVDDILYNAPYEITLILRDNIEKGKFIDIMDFPFPDNLVDENGFFYGEVVITLVTSPFLDGAQGPEYCQTDVAISMGTYDSIKQRDMEVATIRNPIGRNFPENVLLPSHYKARYKKGYQKTSFSAERQLRDDSLKYHPVKKYAVNLSEMTEAHARRSLTSSRKWYLQLKSLTNYAVEQVLERADLTQEFCLIISIRDPHEQHDVYSAVTRKLDAFNFQHSNIRLQNDNRIDLRNTLGGEDPE